MGHPDKREVAEALIERGSVFLYLDPRSDGVVVPEYLRKQPQLVLQVGLDLVVPIPDLEIDGEGISGTLSFNRAPFWCRVPWGSVFGLVGDDSMGVVWHEDLPDEIAAEVDAAKEKADRPLGVAKRPALRAIDGGAERSSAPPAPEGEPEAGTAAAPVRKRGHLRLVE